MEYSKFNFKSRQEIEQFCKENGINIGFSDDLSVLKKQVKIGNKVVVNSLGIHPMEGCDSEKDGSGSDLTIRRYERFADGGSD